MNNLFCTEGVTVTLYPTPESMKQKVEEYFDLCFTVKYNKALDRDVQVVVKPPTYSGLARYLGFKSRSDMLKYVNEHNEAYNEVLADAKLRIEDYLEAELVHSKAPTGIMFSLKNNAGWEEKSKQQLTSADGQPLVFGWAKNADDVINTKATVVEEDEKKGVLPPPPQEKEVPNP